MEDPYPKFRDGLISQIDKIKVKHEKYQDLLIRTDTSTNQEFKDLRRNLLKDFRAIDKDINGLSEAVDQIQKNRSKFPNIKDSELETRRNTVASFQTTIRDLKTQFDSPKVRQKMEADESKGKRQAQTESFDQMRGTSAVERENDRFLNQQQQTTQRNIEDQDEALTHLGSAVDKLGNLSRTINTELKEQNKLLEDVESDMDHASNRMDNVMEKLQKLLQTKNNCMIWTIVILALILIILVALVIWT